MQPSSRHPPGGKKPKAAGAARPIRMGRELPAARRKPGAPKPDASPAGAFRARLYRQILALLALLDRLALEDLCRKDGFGLEWSELAPRVVAGYQADGRQILQELQDMVMSKDGARHIPKEMYRRFLELRKECAAFLEELRKAALPPAAAESPDGTVGAFMQAFDDFKQSTLDLQQQICIFENERGAGEASFFE